MKRKSIHNTAWKYQIQVDKWPNAVHYLLHIYQRKGLSRDYTDRNIRGSEKELSVQVGLLYGVHVCYNDLPIPACQTNHGKVFQ